MAVTRFIAVKFKDEFAGTNETAAQTREDAYRKHLQLYKSRPYVLEVEGSFGGRVPGTGTHGYHYAIVAKCESWEKVNYYDDEDPDHLELKASGMHFIEDMFVWAFPDKH